MEEEGTKAGGTEPSRQFEEARAERTPPQGRPQGPGWQLGGCQGWLLEASSQSVFVLMA